MFQTSRSRIAAAAVGVLLVIAGCSRVGTSTEPPVEPPRTGAVAAAKPALQMAPQSEPSFGGYPAPAPAGRPVGAPPPQPSTASVAEGVGQKDAVSAIQGGAASTVAPATERGWSRMVIRNGALQLQVESVEASLARAREVAARYDGFVAGSSTQIEKVRGPRGDEERQIATLTLQVRSDAFDLAVSDLRRLALKVESEVGTSQDVTEEYVDLEATLKNLRATESAVARLLERATRIEDIVMLTRELGQVRGQIERLEGRKRFLERRADHATISVTLRQPPVGSAVTPLAGSAWDPAATAARGWNASLRVLRTVADLAILAVAFGWWLVPPLALAAFAGLRLVSRRGAASGTA